MEQNPYERIVETMRREGAGGSRAGALRLYLGRVLTAEPLAIEIAGTTQRAADGGIYVGESLLRGHSEMVAFEQTEISGTLYGENTACSYGAGAVFRVDSGHLDADGSKWTLTEPVLQSGDLVLCLSEDDQTFYVIERMVRAT